MRRFLVVVALLILIAVGWFVFFGPKRDAADVTGGGDAATATDETLEAVKAKKAKERVREQAPRAESVSDFLAQWPQIGQDRPQDPKLAAVTGRVLAGVDRPVDEAVVETSRAGDPSARVRTRPDGSFLLKNAPVGTGVSLTARSSAYASGGYDGLLLVAGETLDVGVVYLGSANDPDATNRVEVRVAKAGGEGVPGALVTATSTLAGALVALGAWEKQPGGTVVRVKTDDKGLAVFERLPPNFYDFFSETPGMTFVAKQRVTVQRDTRETFTLEVSPALSISGVVQDEEGKPIGGVRVGALNLAAFTMHPVTNTDDKGAFKIDGLPSGAFWIFAVKQGRGQKDVQNVAAGKQDVVVVMPQGAGMALRVLDAASGKPVTEYTVRPFKNQPFAYVYSPGVSVKAEDGVWRQQLDKGQWGAEVSAKGYAMKALSTVTLDAKEPVDVKLEKGALVHGRVVGKGGAVVRGARVYVKRGGFPTSPVKDQQTVTDGTGEFVLDNLGAAPVKLTIAHIDHTEGTFDAEPAARSADGALPPAAEFVLPDGGRVAGHAFGPGRASIAGQQVTLMKGFDFSGFRQATIAEDGAYEFRHVPPDKYTVSLGGGRGQRGDVEVVEGGVATMDFGADTGGQKVVARLVRGETPVADVNVTLEGGGKSVRARSDAAGRATFEAVQPGAYTISPSFLASSVSAEVVVKAEEAPAEIVLEMPALGAIQVVIVDDSTGKPLAGAWANFEQTADAAGKAPKEVRAGGGNTPTSDDGAVIFNNLEAGRYSLRVWRDPYGSEVLDDVELGAGETKSGLEIRLAGAGVLAGTVKNSQNQPIEGAAVHVKDLKGRRMFLLAFATSSADGTYAQAQVKPGEYDVTVEKEGFAPATQRVVVTIGKETRADFKMLMGGWIDVVVKKQDGETPLANAAVTLFDAAGRRVDKGLTLQNVFSSSNSRTDAQGKITLKGVAAGQYRVEAALDAATTGSGAADVHEGAGTPVEIRLAK